MTASHIAVAAPILQPLAEHEAPNYLPAIPATTLWSRLSCEADTPLLTVDPGTTIVVDSVRHEGILEDQGRDPVSFFAAHGVRGTAVLLDAIQVAADGEHDPEDGPHMVTGPVGVRGARPGDVLAVHIDALVPQVSFGAVSSRRGRELRPERFPSERSLTSVFCAVENLRLGLEHALTFGLIPADDALARFGDVRGPFALTPEFLVPTGLDEDLDTAVVKRGRKAVALLGGVYGMAPELDAYLSAATDFEMSQVVNLVKGAHARIRLADFAALGREVLP
jgi:acetamidase/formamidase